MQLASGGPEFFPLSPDTDRICIADIAISLSKTCRFGGHCFSFYSVAQHSVLVSKLCPPWLALAGLLHDASEAYLGDVLRELKPEFGDYLAIEKRLQGEIYKRFGIVLSDVDRELIKRHDDVALATEKRDLMRGGTFKWGELPDPVFQTIVPLSWEMAFTQFMDRYNKLTRAVQ